MMTCRLLFPLIISGAVTLGSVVAANAAEVGGGTMPVPQDDVGETVDALHLRAVAKAPPLGLTVATAKRPVRPEPVTSSTRCSRPRTIGSRRASPSPTT